MITSTQLPTSGENPPRGMKNGPPPSLPKISDPLLPRYVTNPFYPTLFPCSPQAVYTCEQKNY